MKIEMHRCSTHLRLSWRMRLRYRWHRYRLRRAHGPHVLAMMDEIGRRVEREFLVGQEWNV